MTTSPLEEALRSRRSVRHFRSDPPPKEMIERVLEAATLAPSASNRQPWRFLVLTSKDRIAALAGAVREAKERVAAHIDPSCRDAFLAYGDYFTRFEGAPVVIAVLCRGAQVLSHLVGPTLPDEDRRNIARMERDSGLIGAAMAMENLLLMAHALGLGASGMTGPLLADGALRTHLSVPNGWEIVALVPLGFPDEAPAPTERKSAALVTRWDRMMEMRQDVFEKVRACVAESLAIEPERIASESRLIDDLGANSLDFIDIVFMLERELGIRVRDTELNFLTRLDFSSPEVMKEGFLTRPVVDRLVEWLPALRAVQDRDRVSPRQLFSLITVESICLVAQMNLDQKQAAAG